MSNIRDFDYFQERLRRSCRATPGDRRSPSAERGCASSRARCARNAVRARTSRARCARNAVRARTAGVAGRQWRPFSNDRAGGETFNSVGDCHPPQSKVCYNPSPSEAGDSPTELKSSDRVSTFSSITFSTYLSQCLASAVKLPNT